MVIHRESAFTKPSERCPHPEHWTSQDSDSTENEVLELVAGFVRGLQPDYVIETGTAFGYGAKAIGEALRKNGHGELVTMEIDAGRVAHARSITTGLPVTVLHQASLDYTPTTEIGFAWFDSLFGLRVPEFMAFYPSMTNRTIVGFHDTADHHPLRPGIEELARQGYITPIFLPTPRGVCFAEVHKLNDN